MFPKAGFVAVLVVFLVLGASQLVTVPSLHAYPPPSSCYACCPSTYEGDSLTGCSPIVESTPFGDILACEYAGTAYLSICGFGPV